MKAKNKEPITLVITCNNHFSVMLAALLKSIVVNQDGSSLIFIYIVDDGVSQKNRQLLNAIVQAPNINTIWIPIKKAIPKSVSLPLDGSSFPLCVYVRICIPYFLPHTIEKAIYLDADTLVECDIRKLWEIDMRGLGIAAVTDRAKTVNTSWAGIKNYEELGIPANSLYFNTGVLVMDLTKWREENIPEQVFQHIEENIQYATFPDQYGLNVQFANEWLVLPSYWNSYAQEDTATPHIIHFTGMKPIYKGYQYNEKYKDIFYKYLSLTPFRGFKPRNSYFRLLSKALHILEKKWLAFISWFRTSATSKPVLKSAN